MRSTPLPLVLLLTIPSCTTLTEQWRPMDPLPFTSTPSSVAFGRPGTRGTRHAERMQLVSRPASQAATTGRSATEEGDADEAAPVVGAPAEMGIPGFDSNYYRPDPESGVAVYVDPWLRFDQTPQQPGDALQDPDPENLVTTSQTSDGRLFEWLPVGGQRAIALGYDLPYPIGFGINYSRLRRDIQVDSVRVGVDGPPDTQVDFIDVASDTTSDILIGRVDAWVLPFVNVYGLFGRIWNDVDSTVTFNLPGLGPLPPQSVDVQLPSAPEAPTYGAGVSVNGGIDVAFASFDGVWQKSDFDQFDEEVEIRLFTTRLGWRNRIDEDTRLRVWGGATFWDTARTVSGSVPIGMNTLTYDVDQSPVTEWSLLLGANYEIRKQFSFVLEGQYLKDVRMIVTGLQFRF